MSLDILSPSYSYAFFTIFYCLGAAGLIKGDTHEWRYPCYLFFPFISCDFLYIFTFLLSTFGILLLVPIGSIY